jgi:hypothetical protein
MASSAATCGAGPATLQLAALGRQHCNSRRWPTSRCSLGRQRFWFFFFFLLDNFKSEKERQEEKGRESL